ncbi:MAG: hypothetical protein GY854_33565 [Deltaproteobacteria bacterium]|nr:hypothetical protein [Deltaproteobacteria bacterium]
MAQVANIIQVITQCEDVNQSARLVAADVGSKTTNIHRIGEVRLETLPHRRMRLIFILVAAEANWLSWTFSNPPVSSTIEYHRAPRIVPDFIPGLHSDYS